MTRIIVGEGSTARELAQTVGDEENPRIWPETRAEDHEEPSPSAHLARQLTRFEVEAIARKPASILLADDSDSSLAAAIVAAKLLIPLSAAEAATEAATEAASANGRLIAQLADAYTRRA